ncbi:hypothetical protein [Sphingomonas sp.]|uniref:hypothetical protein n=1 Tax=Sphingomonas sp. TaxID=28214 RepID=UPI00258C34FD|nr:hypothetical protein [Sphingomonas sp.]
MYAALQVIDYAATLPPGALLGAHVDAVWAAAGPELPVPPGAQWKLKGSGTWRAYAPGVYGLGERVAVSGWQDPSEPTMSDLVSFGEAASTGGTSGGRWWHGDPAESRLAWSQPLHLERAP